MIQDSDREVRLLELADWLGVSERAVAEYAHKGIIVRSGRGVVRLKDSIRAVCHHFREGASRRGTTSSLTTQRERIASEQADKLAMQNATARREMISAKSVADEWASVLRMVRSRMLATPSRIQQQLGHLSAHDLDIIDREIRDALTDLSNNGL
jgi:phage terminase Nu1 subunit (DNA packaging protein)